MKCEVLNNADCVTIKKMQLPLLLSSVEAGTPFPVETDIDETIDLNDMLVKNTPDTFFVKVTGESMTGAGIFAKDILIVDRSLQAKDNNIVIAMLDGDLTVKRLRNHQEKWYLVPEHSSYSPIEITNRDLSIWGVVTFVIHRAT